MVKSNGRSDLVDIDCEIIGETERAIRIDDGSKTCWLPRSLSEINDDGTVTIPEWLAMDRELI